MKYRTHETDFESLAKELHGSSEDESPNGAADPDVVPEDDYDEWADYR